MLIFQNSIFTNLQNLYKLCKFCISNGDVNKKIITRAFWIPLISNHVIKRIANSNTYWLFLFIATCLLFIEASFYCLLNAFFCAELNLISYHFNRVKWTFRVKKASVPETRKQTSRHCGKHRLFGYHFSSGPVLISREVSAKARLCVLDLDC